ncbi:hypothetical protein EVAR_10292_1 [Eumeta japonica]|uniref:52 kDa repressor of the inhibitor of the protein kinase n=1 Tax=Eumeta variegata TaxID=151549 RepID=A0A4C1TGS1_EUMVA|nr:hypothetical protein EVAR_10292_1 [Eumeta japonica]
MNEYRQCRFGTVGSRMLETPARVVAPALECLSEDARDRASIAASLARVRFASAGRRRVSHERACKLLLKRKKPEGASSDSDDSVGDLTRPKYSRGLYKLRIDAGDLVLKKHIEHGKKNASYQLIDIQNEIIAICDVIKADIVKKVKEAEAYSVLADETADISAKYSAFLKPVVNALQSIPLDVVKTSQHVKRILQLLKSHRDNPERVTDEIIKDATVVAEKVGQEEDITSMPRIVGKQRHRSNHPAESPSEFWKRSLIIPYLDSVITSLETCFAEENTPSFALSKLHPAQMQTMSLENLTGTCEIIALFYNLPNIKIEVELWQQF